VAALDQTGYKVNKEGMNTIRKLGLQKLSNVTTEVKIEEMIIKKNRKPRRCGRDPV
jgi:hypothetical protein